MALEFLKKYRPDSLVLNLVPLLCSHGNLTLKLHKKIASLMKEGIS